MTHRTTLWLVLMTAALLLTGCDGSKEDAGQTGTDGNDQAVIPKDNPEQDARNEGPGLSTAVDQDGGELGREIPEVNASTLKALRRQAVAQGKVLVIDCWATWCGSCVAMFPHLHEAMKERGEGVLLMSLSFDEGEASLKEAGVFLTKQKAWDNAYAATPGSDAKDKIANALSDNWDGGVLPAVFVYKPDGTTAYEMLETRGEVQDWVDRIAEAVDESLEDADDSPGQ